MKTPNQTSLQLAAAVTAARNSSRTPADDGDKLHVVGAGRTLTSAYEQLRNAAEYTEEHLLLQRAIRRFYKRIFLTHNATDIHTSGEELVTELTMAGYIANDSVPVSVARDLSLLAGEYYSAYSRLHSPVSDQASRWCVDVLAVEVETLLNNHENRSIFVQFAYDQFHKTIDPVRMFEGQQPVEYELALYAAVHRALLKSDEATIRWALLRRFQQAPSQLEGYVSVNEKVDQLLDSKVTDRLTRVVNREGAALRVLWRLMNDHENVDELLVQPNKFLSAYEAQIATEYEHINSRITRGIIKSVVFLIITKFVIGVAIEVPYDYLVYDEILWMPLIVNLLLPPVYMVLLRSTLSLPGEANTTALVNQIEQVLYSDPSSKKLTTITGRRQQYGAAFNMAYGFLFVLVFGLVSWGLVSIGFSIVHLIIFFVFFSAASFLGFRLSRMIRELEAVDSEQSGVAMIRDLIYLPFVVVGRKMNEGYSKFNLMAIILDMLIELPLKTVLRLLRQWGGFINAKKDDL